MLKAGLIGCGKIGSEFANDAHRVGIYTHAAAFDALTDVELHAICDPAMDKLHACAVRYQMPIAQQYADPAAMLAESRLDILSIAAPDGTHAKLALLALETPSIKGILLEKPLALTCEQARQVLIAAQNTNVQLAVNYSRRFCPAHQRVKAAIENFRFGKVQVVQGVYSKGIKHNGTHWLDLVNWFFGEVSEIRAEASGASPYNTDLSPHVQIKILDGILVSLQALDHEAFSLFEMDIFFESGRIRLCEGGHKVEWYGLADSPFYSGYRTLVLQQIDETGGQNTVLYAVQNLCDAVLSARPLLCTAQDAYCALNMAETAMASLAQGGVWLPINK